MTLRRSRFAIRISSQVAAAGSAFAIQDLAAWRVRQPRSGKLWTLLRIRTREGVEGWGECQPLSRDAFVSLRELLAGQSAASIEALRLRLREHPASGAVNIAGYDILARAANAPLHQFLGGPTRNRARAFTALHGEDDAALMRSLEKAQAAGFRAFAVPVAAPRFRNSGKAFVLGMRRRLEQLRKAAGEEADFVLSAAGLLTPGDAASLASEFERFHLLWFDEPCATTSLGPVKKLAEENVTPLGFGQGIADAAHFQNLLREDAVDLIRPELARHGVTGVRKIAALAEVYYVAVAPRVSEGPLMTAAAIHVAASLPNFFIQYVSYPQAPEDVAMRASFADRPVEAVRDGYLELPAGAGLGVRPSAAWLSRYGEAIS